MGKAEEYNKNKRDLFPVILSGNQKISPGVHLISWTRNGEFVPGQVVKIAMNENDQPRIYSLCCGNQESEMSVLFNVKEEGQLTPHLSSCIPGDKIWVSQAYGSFIDASDAAFWIATGTGIAPFYSMFRSSHPKNRTLIHGARYLNQFYFEDELEWALEDCYVRCCSQEQSCNVFPGRVTDYLRQQTLPSDQQYYICGKALMVVEVRDLLIEKGIPYENIVSEIYF